MLLVILTVSQSAARRAVSSAAIVLTRLSSAASAASASALAKALAWAVNFMALNPEWRPSPRSSRQNGSVTPAALGLWTPVAVASPPLDLDDIGVAGFANDAKAACVDIADCTHPQ